MVLATLFSITWWGVPCSVWFNRNYLMCRWSVIFNHFMNISRFTLTPGTVIASVFFLSTEYPYSGSGRLKYNHYTTAKGLNETHILMRAKRIKLFKNTTRSDAYNAEYWKTILCVHLLNKNYMYIKNPDNLFVENSWLLYYISS